MPRGKWTVAVVGLGASGDAAARLALNKGAKVHVTDASNDEAVAARGAGLRRLGAAVQLGSHDPERIAKADVVVASPGIPPDAPVFRALRERRVGWISEPEFASGFIASPLVVVTGTNGKTTTAAMTAHLLRESGTDAALGGNTGPALGPPASALALLEPAPEVVVLEASSFQLAGIRDLVPAVGVVTNLGADHLDRYPSVAAYHRDKRRLLEAGTDDTTWVLNADDPAVDRLAQGAPGRRLSFSLERPQVPGAYLQAGALTLNTDDDGPRPLAPAATLRLPGRHNAANALAAVLAAWAAGADRDALGPALASFRPLPHRLEQVGEVGGVRWINDSKATNVAACASALRGLDGPLVLLLGGSDKGEDFRSLAAEMADKARAVVAYGAAGGRVSADVRTAAGGRFPVVEAFGDFSEIVERASALARPGDALLLSPACASFDMFPNYEARGDAFRALAQAAAARDGASGPPGGEPVR